MAKKTHWTEVQKSGWNGTPFIARYYSTHRKIEREFKSSHELNAWIEEQNTLVTSCKNDQEYLITMDNLLTLRG